MRLFTFFSLFLLAHIANACAQDAASPIALGNPELVQEVVEGKREEAKASWWGFDPKDSTRFLQDAIDSKVKRLIIDRQDAPWSTLPLQGVSNQEIVFEAGTELIALPRAFKAKGDCLLSFHECENVVLRGEKSDAGKSAHIRMHKNDYQSDAYDKSEWRHGLAFHACTNILVQDITIERTGGDAIYLGTNSKHTPNRNVTIRRVDCNENHRQGISVISAEDLLIEDCQLRNTQGTAPQAGIDFEPNNPEDVLVRCVVRRCIAEGNSGTGFQICPQFMTSKSTPMSIKIVDCISRKNKQHAVHLIGNPSDPPNGTLQITGLLAENDAMAGLSIQFNPFDAVLVELNDSTFRNCAQDDKFFPPLYLQSLNDKGRALGNLFINNLTIEDDLERPILKIRDKQGNGVQKVSGTITLKRKGQINALEANSAWLKSMTE